MKDEALNSHFVRVQGEDASLGPSPETFILRSSRLLLRRTEVQGRADPALLKNFYSMWRGDAENNHNSLMVLEYCFFYNFLGHPVDFPSFFSYDFPVMRGPIV